MKILILIILTFPMYCIGQTQNISRKVVSGKDTSGSFWTGSSSTYLDFKSTSSYLAPKSSVYMRPDDIYEFIFTMGGEKVAYKKKDSSWVFINPDKTRIILDSLCKPRL